MPFAAFLPRRFLLHEMHRCRLSVLTNDEAWILHSVDVELFLEGIADMIRINGRDPSYISGLFGVLSNLAASRPPKGLSPDMRDAWGNKMDQIDTLANQMLHQNLTAICPSIWAMGVEGALDAVTQSVRTAFDAGHNFAIGEDGIAVIA